MKITYPLKWPLAALAAAVPLATLSQGTTIIEKVRVANDRYQDVNVAIGEGWVQGTPCVSGPTVGGMGIHFVQPERFGDATLLAEEPDALVYQPLPDGQLQLVGVEFITIADTWHAANEGPPSLDGHLFHFVGEPNRYGLPAFYELHVWAFQANPNGTFADFNPEVSCDAQPADSI